MADFFPGVFVPIVEWCLFYGVVFFFKELFGKIVIGDNNVKGWSDAGDVFNPVWWIMEIGYGNNGEIGDIIVLKCIGYHLGPFFIAEGIFSGVGVLWWSDADYDCSIFFAELDDELEVAIMKWLESTDN